jgi:hypothetical protein
VHFVLDRTVAHDLEQQWSRLGLSGVPLDLVECPDRRLTRAATELVAQVASDGETEVGVMLPRRVFEGLWRRVLHDRTADRIAGYISQLPNANATIVPFPLGKRRRELVPWAAAAGAPAPDRRPDDDPAGGRPAQRLRPARAEPLVAPAAEPAGGRRNVEVPGTIPIEAVRWRQRARVAGRVHTVRVQPGASLTSLECTISDGSGSLVLVFQGRRRVPGIEPGVKLLVEGMVGERGKRPAMINPVYQIVAVAEPSGSGSPA